MYIKKSCTSARPFPYGWVPSEGTVALCGAYVQYFGTPLPLRGGFPPKKEGYWLNNHDNSFYACAFIIRLNNPILCEHNRLFSPYNKKECSFFEEIVAFSCICEKFVVPLHSLSIREIYRGVEQW